MNWDLLREIVAAALIVASAIVVFSAALGVARFPDAYTRMHAATKAGVVGAGGILLGCGLAVGSWPTLLAAVLGVFFLLATVTIAGHTLGRAAYLSGSPLAEDTVADALQDVYERHDFDHIASAPPAPARTSSAAPE